jgi:hypothetical protein
MEPNLQENDYCKLWIDNNILFCRFQPYLEINMKVIQQCVADRIRYTAGKSYPMLADVKYLKFFTVDAREYFATREACYNIQAIAFLVNTHIEKFLVHAFIEINTPPIPCSIFTEKKAALDWLFFIKAQQQGE